MARAGIQIARMSILRETKQAYRGFRRFAKAVDYDEPAESFTREDSVIWVPDPRSGIYFPQGQERVMADVPKGAASFGGRTYWLRNDDGVEKPDYESDAVGFPDELRVTTMYPSK